MMPDTNNILEQLDWHTITCQCEQQACTQAGGCPNPATEHIEFHAIDHCNTTDPDINPFGNYTFLLCLDCLQTLAHVVAHELAKLNRYGRKTCTGCGAPACELSDAIREVRTL